MTKSDWRRMRNLTLGVFSGARVTYRLLIWSRQ